MEEKIEENFKETQRNLENIHLNLLTIFLNL